MLTMGIFLSPDHMVISRYVIGKHARLSVKMAAALLRQLAIVMSISMAVSARKCITSLGIEPLYESTMR